MSLRIVLALGSGSARGWAHVDGVQVGGPTHGPALHVAEAS
jgi:hypothetical protein